MSELHSELPRELHIEDSNRNQGGDGMSELPRELNIEDSNRNQGGDGMSELPRELNIEDSNRNRGGDGMSEQITKQNSAQNGATGQKPEQPGNQKQPFLKRYGAFFILLAAGIATGLILPDLGKQALSNTLGSFKEMLSVLPPIFVLLGLLDVWVDRATMVKYTGKGSGFKGVLIAFLLGSAAAGPLYAAFPFAGVMLKKGSSLMNVLIFIGAWSTTKIPLLAFEAASMGPKFTLIRLGLSIVGIPLIAFVTQKALGKKELDEIATLNGAQ